MPYKVDWLIENEILLYTFWGRATVEDLRGAFTELGELISASQNDNIHTISDITKITETVKMQDSMKLVLEFRAGMSTKGWSITVGKLDVFTKMGITVSRSLMQRKATTFDTMDEALAHLKAEDSSLSWDKLNTDFLDFSLSDKK